MSTGWGTVWVPGTCFVSDFFAFGRGKLFFASLDSKNQQNIVTLRSPPNLYSVVLLVLAKITRRVIHVCVQALRTKAKQVLSFSVPRYPTLLAFCNGDISSVERFEGEIKSEAVAGFVRQFAGGKKCVAAIKLDENTNFNKLRVGQLKQILKDRGVSCPECVEKSEYVNRVKSLVLEGSRTEL